MRGFLLSVVLLIPTTAHSQVGEPATIAYDQQIAECESREVIKSFVPTGADPNEPRVVSCIGTGAETTA